MVFKIILGVMVVALMVGPIMMMQPTKSERRLAKLRGLALKKKLKVRSVPHPADTRSPPCASYTLSWPEHFYNEANKSRFSYWKLQLLAFDHEIHFHKRWNWTLKPEKNLDYTEELKAKLNNSPIKMYEIEVGKLGVTVVWSESVKEGGEESIIEEVFSFLNSIIELEMNQFRVNFPCD